MMLRGKKVMKRKEYLNDLFKDESDILKSAREDLDNAHYRDNELFVKYSQLVMNYDKLLKFIKKAFRISDVQGDALKRRENEIKNLLNSSNQGFLMFGRDLLVNQEYSLECQRIFDRKIANLNIVELLAGSNNEQASLFKSVFLKVFMTQDVDLRYTYLEELPGILKINCNDINVKYQLTNDSEFETDNDTLMLILTDITEKRKAQDQLLYLSYHDSLTSLYNRAYVESITPQLQTESSMPLSIIMADMNGLKLTNDVFGHEVGDRLLVITSNIQSCCRNSDFVVRWGGDEFLIILPNTDATGCKKLCDRIRESCNNASADPISVSISLGAASIEKAGTNLPELINIAENMMYSNKLAESKKTRRKIVSSIEKILHTKCFEDSGHMDRIRKMTMNFAEVLGFESESDERARLNMLATFHDIGKVAIPKEILGKSQSLTKNEWEIMRSHTKVGFRMAQSIEEPMLAQAILAMREWWDGTGYPSGLQNTQIPFDARVVAIIDAYDVMTHNRPYRNALSQDEAEKELRKCSGRQFDPELVELFLENIDYIVHGNG